MLPVNTCGQCLRSSSAGRYLHSRSTTSRTYGRSANESSHLRSSASTSALPGNPYTTETRVRGRVPLSSPSPWPNVGPVAETGIGALLLGLLGLGSALIGRSPRPSRLMAA